KRLPKDLGWPEPFGAENAPLVKGKENRYRLAEQLIADRQPTRAAEILTRLIAQCPDDPTPHLLMARILTSGGQPHIADEPLLRARKLAPDNLQVDHFLGVLLFQRAEALEAEKGGDRQEARALFEKAAGALRRVVAARPDHGFSHLYLGLALGRLGRRAASLAALRQAVHCNPEYADTPLSLGSALAEAGEVREAREHLEQAALLAGPDDPRPKAALERLPARDSPGANPG